MTKKEAYQILGLPPGAAPQEIKKRYRNLMMQVHPDANLHTQETYTYTAQEINTAYSLLKENPSPDSIRPDKDRRPKKKQRPSWNAPLNPQAYIEREVLQYIQDPNGTILGNFCIARGKYLWTTEEDFPLFLLSLYRCSQQLLEDADTSRHPQIQTELTYLLAQQFIAGIDLLREFAREERPDTDGRRIFYVPSMLESTGPSVSLRAGETLYPAKLCQHRLYLKDQAGQGLGYLSFADDRLYYIVIPLFEQKRVQVQIKAAEKQPSKKSAARYQNLHLWLKLYDEEKMHMSKELDLQIRQLLAQLY